MLNFLSKLFGSKSQRDLKEVQPFLDATLKVYPAIKELSNDDLRAKTDEFKKRIQDEIREEEEELVYPLGCNRKRTGGKLRSVHGFA